MLTTPMDILAQFPVRKSKLQKQAFREAVQSYASGLGYECKVEQGSYGCRNLVFGDPETAKILVTAHYDTPARMPWPNSIAPTNFLLSTFKSLPVMVIFMLCGYFTGYFLGTGRIPAAIAAFLLMIGILLLVRCGPANPNNANDNTSGVVTVLEIMRTLLPAYRDKVCFVLFDLEEAGLIGSAAYRKAHKAATENQVVLNLDCVGDGDSIIFFPCKKLKKDSVWMDHLRRCGGWFGNKHLSVHEKGYANYPSDHIRFPLSVGIGAFHKKNGKNPCLKRIHTVHDTVLDETNVNILRACISTLISMQ